MTFAYLSARYLLYANAYLSAHYLLYAKTGNYPGWQGGVPQIHVKENPSSFSPIQFTGESACICSHPSPPPHRTGMTRAIGGRDPGGWMEPRSAMKSWIVHEYRTWVSRQKRSGFPTPQQEVKSPDFVKPRLWPRLINHGTDLTELVSLSLIF